MSEASLSSLGSAAYPSSREAPRPKLPAFSRLALSAAAALGLAASLALSGPDLDIADPSPHYASAAAAIEAAREAGFSASDISLGGESRSGAGAQGQPSDGHSAKAVSSLTIDGDPQCEISLPKPVPGSPVILGEPSDAAFVALHEASHCDARFSSWLSFQPSASLLDEPQAQALRALLAASLSAEDRLPGHGTSGALPSVLFHEMAADLRALAVLAKTSPREQWRQAGWDAWMARSFDNGTWGAYRDHATAKALSIFLSIDPAKIESSSPEALERLVGRVASDALVLEISEQGLQHSLGDPAAQAAAASKGIGATLGSRHAYRNDYRDGYLQSGFGGAEGLEQTQAFLDSPRGAEAIRSLQDRLSSLERAPLPMAFSYGDPGAPLRASLSPNLGFAELDTSHPLPRSDELARGNILALAAHLGAERARANFPQYRPGNPAIARLADLGSALAGPSRADISLALAEAGISSPSISPLNLWSLASKDPASLFAASPQNRKHLAKAVEYDARVQAPAALNIRLADSLGVSSEPIARSLPGFSLGGFLDRLERSRPADAPKKPASPGSPS